MPYLTQAEWYIEHRIEYLENRLQQLRESLLEHTDQTFDYERFKAFMETRGRLKELKNIRDHMKTW